MTIVSLLGSAACAPAANHNGTRRKTSSRNDRNTQPCNCRPRPESHVPAILRKASILFLALCDLFFQSFLQGLGSPDRVKIVCAARSSAARALYFSVRATRREMLGPANRTTRNRAACSAITKERSTLSDAAAMIATESMPPGLVAR